MEGVEREGELYDYLSGNDGTAFIYADYDYLLTMSAAVKQIVKYGTTDGLVQGNIIANEPFLKVGISAGYQLSIPYKPN